MCSGRRRQQLYDSLRLAEIVKQPMIYQYKCRRCEGIHSIPMRRSDCGPELERCNYRTPCVNHLKLMPVASHERWGRLKFSLAERKFVAREMGMIPAGAPSNHSRQHHRQGRAVPPCQSPI